MARRWLSTKKLSEVDEWLKSNQIRGWPARCVLCGGYDADHRDLCAACLAELPYAGSSCRLCALPLSSANICGGCQKLPPTFDSSLAVFEYCSPIDRMIQGLKFNARLYYGRILGQMMAETLLTLDVDQPDCIIPVPLHVQRLCERGFNQAQELARPVAKALGLPLELGVCRRFRATPPQMRLNAKARRENIKGAFSVIDGARFSHVVLLDDVMTTGSTVEALAAELKRSGVKRVDVWLCARAL